MKEFTVDHFWSSWVHGEDILRRGFLSGIKIRRIDNPSSEMPKKKPDASVITVPIRDASNVVHKILDNRGEKHPIIDFSGIMRSNQVTMGFAFPQVYNIHLLFWPKGTGKLNWAYSWWTPRNGVFEHILNNIERTEEAKISLTPLDTQTHDTIMALVQGITHAVATLICESPECRWNTWDALRERRKWTPSTTIADMIALNPHLIMMLSQMRRFGSINSGCAHIRGRIEKHLKNEGKKLDSFITPFFSMLERFLRENDIDGKVSTDDLESLTQMSLWDLTKRIEDSKNI